MLVQKWTIDNSKMFELGLCELSNHENETITLLSLNELKTLKQNNPHTLLISIHGEETLAIDADEDTRFGYVAFGFPQ